jgi:hypothetical protein
MKQALTAAAIILSLTSPVSSLVNNASTRANSLAGTDWPTMPTWFSLTSSGDTHAASLAGTGGRHHHHAAAPAPAAAGNVEHAAKHAQEAAKVAKQAAGVANDVAEHSIKITGHAKKALKHALGALHDARVDSKGLDKDQKHSLNKAEAHLREATKTAEHGKLKKFKDEQDLEKEKMQAKLDKAGSDANEKDELREQVRELREKLKGKKHDKDLAKALKELEQEIEESDGSNYDEIKAELERLREVVDRLPDKEHKKHLDKSLAKDIGMQPLGGNTTIAREDVTPVEDKEIDIDTQMPFGELEPFGREDTAQELTERSITESDDMVDQLERAEVAEEKRAVFRALTRLRGAAITSYDGVARSQSGNIDEYNKIHKWRKAHPLHHLADEESDVQKWAFPDNADLIQWPTHKK